MSTYHPELFTVQRLAGHSWIAVPAASLTWSSNYDVVSHNAGDEWSHPPSNVSTLVVGTETATVSYTRWDLPGTDILYPADQVRAIYDGQQFFLGAVESVTITKTADPEARRHGATRRVEVEAAIGGWYAHLLSRTVYWGTTEGPDGVDHDYGDGLPEEPWLVGPGPVDPSGAGGRIRRWVAVT
jgi:hypothetical protein